MIGRNWTARSAVVRISAMMPILMIFTPRLPLPWTFLIGGVLILWAGFVCARVAINDHRAASETPPFRPARRSR
jgi:carbon starvation protein CstA